MYENRKRPKTGRMEVLLDGNYRFFYEDSDFEIEIGPRWPKVAEDGPKIFRINFTNLIKNLIFYQKVLLNFVDQPSIIQKCVCLKMKNGYETTKNGSYEGMVEGTRG